MPTVLVTRPQADSERLAARLAALRGVPFVEPLLRIVPFDSARPVAGGVRALILTSHHALMGLESRRDSVADLRRKTVFCVGPRTAEAARAFGFQDVVAADSDGTSLAAAIRTALPPGPAPFLHICGADRAGKADTILRAAGYNVALWPVYKAEALERLTDSLKAKLVAGDIAAALFFSPRTASVFGALAARDSLQACCRAVTAIGLSEAVAASLRAVPWGRILVAARPSEDEMVATLRAAFEDLDNEREPRHDRAADRKKDI